MTASLAHRGPDGSGIWTDPAAGIGLCHTRLAVLDLSAQGSQPMSDPQGRGVISYNGEVYNYADLRRELESKGWEFRSRTDTEVVLAACLTWGVPRALERFTGMFAFAFWNAEERALYLVRDRLGIKPLYYGYCAGTGPDGDFVFGSELKALCAHAAFERSMDPRSLEQYLMLRYVPAPGSMYRHARKLPAGHYLRLTSTGRRIRSYWNAYGGTQAAAAEPFQWEEELDELVTEAVRIRLVSDVPVGTFLSGGIDSGLVTARVKQFMEGPLSAFTISFTEPEYDEGPPAAVAAEHLSARHRVLTIGSRDLLPGLEKLPSIYDEPLSDPSALPLVRLSEFARQEVTVVLSGDGGDELFGGYDRYRFLMSYWKGPGRWPGSVRRRLSSLLGFMPAAALGTLYHGMYSFLGRDRPVENFAGKWEKLVRLLGQSGAVGAYQVSIGVFSAQETSALLGTGKGVDPPDTFPRHLLAEGGRSATFREMMDLDLETFLPEDVLSKVDRASMAAGLEVRVPLLDHRIVEMARRLPTAALLENGFGKAPIRRFARRVLPGPLLNRAKMGFTLPLDAWFRNELKDVLQDRLLAPNGPLRDILDREVVSDLIRMHLSGKANHQEKLYNLLTLDMWMDRWIKAA